MGDAWGGRVASAAIDCSRGPIGGAVSAGAAGRHGAGTCTHVCVSEEVGCPCKACTFLCLQYLNAAAAAVQRGGGHGATDTLHGSSDWPVHIA
eukprot:1141976-Pelagomonas_calceolata.AAC.2